MTDAYYELVDAEDPRGERFAASDHVISTWSADMQNAAPVSALLLRALERCAPRPDARLTRVMVDLLGPVPMAGPLWAEQTGTGRPLVLLHGNGESHRVFDRMVPQLAQRHRLVGLDSRGHGASPRGDGPLTIARMADDVDAALDALDLRAVDVLGFSDGGNIALELAVRHPGRAGSLVVVTRWACRSIMVVPMWIVG